MPGNANLRNAFIAQGLLVAMLASVVAVCFFLGANSMPAFTFGGLGAVTALVLSVWSVVLSIRAVRSGAQWRWAGVVWALAFIELVLPGCYYWANITPGSFVISLLIGVLLPLLAIMGAFVAAAAVLARRFPRRRVVVIALVTLASLPVLLLLAPTGAYLVTAFNSLPAQSRPADRAAVSRYPEWFRDGIDRFLAARQNGTAASIHGILCFHGMLSRGRILEILNSDDPNSEETWWGLQELEPELAASIALELASGKYSKSDRICTLAIDMGEFMAEKGTPAQVTEFMKNIQSAPYDMKTYFLKHLGERDDCFKIVEKVVLHRQCSDAAVIENLGSALGIRAPADRVKGQYTKQIYYDWAFAKNNIGTQRARTLSALINTCRRTTDPQIRRLAATALADVLKIELHHTPFADAMMQHGDPAPVPVTLDESEELEQLCNTAQAEIDRYTEKPKD